MQLAASLTGTRLVVAAVTCSAAFGLYRAWPAPEAAPPRPPPAPTYHYVPMLGDPTHEVEDAGQSGIGGCVPFVTPLTAHPHWSLQLVEGASGCTGDWIQNTYEVTPDGVAMWVADGMPARELHLTRAELAVITGMNRIDCAQVERPSYSSSWIRVAPGGDPRANGGAVIPASSMLGIVLDGVLTQAIARYRSERLAAVGSFELHLIAERRVYTGEAAVEHLARYRIDLDARGHLTVSRGRHELIARDLDDGTRIDLLDTALSHVFATPDPELEPARGELLAAGLRIPTVLSRWDDSELQLLWRVFDDALDVESNR